MLWHKYKAKITYTIDKGHTDFKYCTDWSEDKRYEFEDEYMFDESTHSDVSIESVYEYIKQDLMLVAGGGYDTKHIHDIEFEINYIGKGERRMNYGNKK